VRRRASLLLAPSSGRVRRGDGLRSPPGRPPPRLQSGNAAAVAGSPAAGSAAGFGTAGQEEKSFYGEGGLGLERGLTRVSRVTGLVKG